MYKQSFGKQSFISVNNDESFRKNFEYMEKLAGKVSGQKIFEKFSPRKTHRMVWKTFSVESFVGVLLRAFEAVFTIFLKIKLN